MCIWQRDSPSSVARRGAEQAPAASAAAVAAAAVAAAAAAIAAAAAACTFPYCISRQNPQQALGMTCCTLIGWVLRNLMDADKLPLQRSVGVGLGCSAGSHHTNARWHASHQSVSAPRLDSPTHKVSRAGLAGFKMGT